MKYLVFLSLLVLVTGLIYWRLRPYINAVRRVFGVVRDAQQRVNAAPSQAADATRREAHAPRARGGENLVRCGACGTWLPASRALSLGSSVYCSHACLERSVDAPRHTRRSAS
ncbi:MAG: hypothetical protein M3458_18825 [Acidobacteriota bacterium]|nr:hypothetical protein [Acidobacteriota bacterium]